MQQWEAAASAGLVDADDRGLAHANSSCSSGSADYR
jgi:hypothetical protein